MELPGSAASSSAPVPVPVPAWVSVYRLAGALGSELQRLSARVGPAAVAGLVAQVVRLLELLETLALPAPPPGLRLGLGEEDAPPTDPPAQALEPRRLGALLAQAQEENQRLRDQLAGPRAPEGHACHKEREVMLRLKEVVDKQRHEIRAQGHEIAHKARDAEALQEQLSRFMAVNEELRQKLAVVQAQLKSALQEKEEAEKALREARREAAQPSTPRATAEAGTWMEARSSESPPKQSQDGGSIPWEELRQILTERNELKTSLFLVQEELAYYQRELLNDERIPAILLDAVRSTIRKQRKKIRAKMLGTAEELDSSEEEEDGVWVMGPLGSSDCPDGHLPESRIKSFFSQWYRRSSPTDSGPAGAWEIVDPQDVDSEQEEEEGSPSSTSGPPRGTLPCP